MATEEAVAAVEAHKRPDEEMPDLWRRVLEEWLATRDQATAA